MFLSFLNFYKRFIKNFGRITVALTSMLQITDNKTCNTQITENKKNRDVSAGSAGAGSNRVGRSIENLSIVAKLAKSKKPKLTKPKKSNLVKAQNFAKAKSFETDFLISKAKKIFIYLQKAFTKRPMFH